jgi:hypothetical protein
MVSTDKSVSADTPKLHTFSEATCAVENIPLPDSDPPTTSVESATNTDQCTEPSTNAVATAGSDNNENTEKDNIVKVESNNTEKVESANTEKAEIPVMPFQRDIIVANAKVETSEKAEEAIQLHELKKMEAPITDAMLTKDTSQVAWEVLWKKAQEQLEEGFILGPATRNGKRVFLVEWRDGRHQVLTETEIKAFWPQLLIRFYEKNIYWMKNGSAYRRL